MSEHDQNWNATLWPDEAKDTTQWPTSFADMAAADERLKEVSGPSINVHIYMAGPIDIAKQVCREWCFEVGACVNVDRVDYIYTGGEEAGFKIGFINYQRFPATEDELMESARELGDLLMYACCQESYSIVGPQTTMWVSRRKGD